jgi:hypothetical protein
MVLRFAVAVVGAVSLLCAAPQAYACQFPDFSLVTTSAGPGDEVGFTISEVDQNARWDVYLAGQWVAGEVSDGSPVRRSFTMPDLGSRSYSVTVSAQIDHDDGPSQPTPERLEYRAPAPPSEPSPEPSPAPMSPAEPALVTPEPEQPPRPPTQTHREPDAHRSLPAGPHRTPVPAGQYSTRQQRTSRAEARPVGRSRKAVLGGDHATRSLAADDVVRGGSARPVAARRLREAARRVPEARRARPTQAPRRASAPAPTNPTQPIAPASPGLTAVFVGLTVLVLVAAAAALLYLIRRHRPEPGGAQAETMPPWIPPEVALEARARDLLIEVELQELIAEERARQIAREAAAIRSGPG